MVCSPSDHFFAKDNLSALEKKWSEGELANPAINLVGSGLSVLDIDNGLGDFDHALRWAATVGIDNTLIVKTSRGFHFYFRGVCDQTPFRYKGSEIKGDIKCKGYVLAPGAINDSGLSRFVYTIVKDVQIMALPEWIRDYKLGAKKAKRAKAPAPNRLLKNHS